MSCHLLLPRVHIRVKLGSRVKSMSFDMGHRCPKCCFNWWAKHQLNMYIYGSYFVWKERGDFLCCFTPRAGNIQSWAILDPEAWNSPLQVCQKHKCISYHLLPSTVHISRKLELGVKLKSRHSNVRCESPERVS